VDITSDDPRPPSHARGVRPASSAPDEAGPAAPRGAPPWLDLPDDEAPRRRRWVLAAAVLPWLVLAVLVARTPTNANEPTAAASPVPQTTPTPTTSPAAGASIPPGNPNGAIGGPTATRVTGGRSALGLSDVAAVAIPVVRAWLGAAEPLRIEGIESREYGWVEHAVVEAVDHPGQGAAVASVLAVVLPTDGEDWLDAEVLRVAVPLRVLDTQVRPAGEPWLLPPPILTVAPLDTTPVPEPHELDMLVGLELAEMYGGVQEIHGFFATEAWPLVADVTILDPLDGRPRRQQIWIRASATSFPVAGWFSAPPEGVSFADTPVGPSEADTPPPPEQTSYPTPGPSPSQEVS